MPREAAPSEGAAAVGAEARPSADEFAVQRVLHSYEAAYERLDAQAAADVWPSVDRRALSRAFVMLKSQELEFQSCAVAVNERRATIYCRGTLELVRKVGNPAPLTARQEWVFRMRRAGGDWKIDEVTATQVPLLATTRGGQD